MITVIVLLAFGVIGLVFGLVRFLAKLIFHLWSRSAQRAPLPEPERNLRRAGRAAGCVALLLLLMIVCDALGGNLPIIATIRAPGNAGIAAIVYAFLLGFSLVQLVIDAVGCWGLRRKELAVAASITFVFGFGLALYLWLHFWLLRLPALPPAWQAIPLWLRATWPLFAAQAGFVIGLWCLVTGATRLLLLTLGGSGALRRVARHIGERVGRLRPARPRSY